jgi:nicotinamidase-related amidase
MPDLLLPLRTYDTYPDAGRAWIESNNHYSEARVAIPTQQTALVLVDVWDFHPSQSNLARGHEIVVNRIVPAVAEARRVGITVIHAPDLSVARNYPDRRVYARADDDSTAIAGTYPRWGYLRWSPPVARENESASSETWPPEEFLRRAGDYAQYHRPMGPVGEFALAHPVQRWIDPAVNIENDDVVIGRGIELQRLCAGRKILHLIYAGFATNMCLQYKDYGVRAFAERGYNVILLRDCTTAMESHDTVAEEGGTRQAIRELEMEVLATTESDSFIAASRQIDSPSENQPRPGPSVAG